MSFGSLALVAGTVLKERYQLDKVLGQGGFGITYLAKDKSLERDVAIKELAPAGATRYGTTLRPPTAPQAPNFTELKKKFLKEGQILAQFKQNAIVRVLDLFGANGTAYIVMEYLGGESLQNRLEREGRIAPQNVVPYAQQVLTGLSTVHGVRLLHRDLKPDNLIVTPDDQIVMIDFGSARNFASKTLQHTRLVTPGYAPPEQYSTQARFGPYTDLYALGATLYHALAGAPPPPSTDRLMGTALAPLPQQVPTLLQDTVMQAMELRAPQRFQSATAMLKALEPLTKLPPKSTPSTHRAAPPTRPVSSSSPAHPASSTRAVSSSPPTNRPATARHQTHTLPPEKSRVKNQFIPALLLGIVLTVGVWQGWAQNALGWRDALASWIQAESTNQAIIPSQNPGSTSATVPVAPQLPTVIANPIPTTSQASSVWQPSQEQQFIRNAEAGGTVRLSAGTFILPRKLTLTNDVEIIGAGQDQTIIQSSARDSVIEFIGPGSLVISDLALEHTGSLAADVLSVGSGTVNITNIVVRGAVFSQEMNQHGMNPGEGLRFWGSARGTVRDAFVHDNENNGIWVQDQATINILDSRLENNGESGIGYGGRAQGTANYNTIVSNNSHGILVTDRATPTLRGNTLRNNEGSGVVYSGEAGGTLIENTSEENAHYGIYVGAQASPILRENMTLNNRYRNSVRSVDNSAALVMHTQQGGTIFLEEGVYQLSRTLALSQDVEIIGAGRGQTIIRSSAEENAIEFTGSGTFALSDLTVAHIGTQYSSVLGVGSGRVEINNITVQGARRDFENSLYGEGIHFYGSARGTVRNSYVALNEWTGIAVRGRAAPTLLDNEVRDNGASGIAYGDDASGTAQDNVMRNNPRNGIYVGAQATPSLEGNTLQNNGQAGIAYYGRAGGNANRNISEQNGSHGILCAEQANAVIAGNALRRNREYGFGSHAGATCRELSNSYAGNTLGSTGRWTP